MSDLLNEMIYLVGIEYLSEHKIDKNLLSPTISEARENNIYPDFDHITVI